jgi:hypothetical protein
MRKAEGMSGQWIGDYTGSTGGGKIIINIDERESNYQGVVYLHADDKTLPTTAAFFSTPNKDRKCGFRTVAMMVIDPASGNPVFWDAVKDRFPANLIFSKYADATAALEKDSLALTWTSDVGGTGNCVLPRSRAGDPSELVPQIKSWDEYKQYVSQLRNKRYLFRGQNGPWRLRTSFHRTGRADLARFLRDDVPVLHRHLSARTKHVFNLQIPDENGAFFNLIQHHGYPTPLLDWTYSPYVAAFFAYRGIPRERVVGADSNAKVRITIFDQERWKTDLQQLLLLAAPFLNLSVGEFIAIENERMIPQQAASTLSSVDDIEAYIKSKESESKKYLWAIDLPLVERDQVMHELNYMGITAGSLFPGLDGACEELTERNFQL